MKNTHQPPPTPSGSVSFGSLSRKQKAAIPHLVAARSLQDGCRRAKLSKSTLYQWLRDDGFRIELAAARDRVINQSLETLKGGVCSAVEVLLEFLHCDDKWLKMNACREVLSHYFKIAEVEDLKKRIDALEARLLK